MTSADAYRTIKETRPPVIFITGKTSTGKSTFGRRLRDEMGYTVVELEAMLVNLVKRHELDENQTFKKVFYESENSEERNWFLDETDEVITKALRDEHPLIIEGAVANANTLQRILQPTASLYFLYFHPKNIDDYVRNLTERFKSSSQDSNAGLPIKFWQMIDSEQFKTFCNTQVVSDDLERSIKEYALASQKESVLRLEKLQEKFHNVVVIDI